MNTPDTKPGDLEARARQPRMKYDPTINLGHLLSLCAFLTAGSVAYFDLRERVSMNEARVRHVEVMAAEDKVRIREALTDMRIDVRETRRAVEVLADKR